MTGLRLYLLIMFAPLAVATLRRRLPGKDLIDAALFLHICWSAFAISQSSASRLLENTGANTLELLGGYLIARLCIQDKKALCQTTIFIASLAALTLPLALLESLTDQALLIAAIEAMPGIRSVEVIDIQQRLGLYRSQTVFAHPIHYGLFCSSALAMVWFGTKAKPVSRYLLCFALCLATFFALSSGALLSLFIQLALICWIITFGSRKNAWLGLGAVLIVAYIGIDILSNRSPIRVFMSYATFSSHNAYWRGLIFEWGMINVWQNPWVGLGFNDWIRPAYMLSGSLDNFWLTVAMRYGIPGFGFLAIAVVFGISRVAQVSTEADRDVRLGWIIAMVGFVTALCTVHVWTAIYSFFFFLLGAGQFLNSAKKPRTQARPVQEQSYQFSRNLKPVFAKGGVSTCH